MLHLLGMTHADLINLWPSLSDFASDIGVGYESAKAMRRRSSIPCGYWKYMVEAASRRGLHEVSFVRLADIAAIAKEVPA
jgi:hypothetical protein